MKVFLALIILSVISTGVVLAAPVNAKVAMVKGRVEAKAPGAASFVPVKVGDLVASGTTVRTGAKSEVAVAVTPGAAIKLGPNAVAVLKDMEFESSNGKVKKRRATVELTSGTVSALIDENDPKATDFKVKTPQGVAAARGTFFAVKVEKNQTYVLVKEGKVGASGTTQPDTSAGTATAAVEQEWTPLVSRDSQ